MINVASFPVLHSSASPLAISLLEQGINGIKGGGQGAV